tara:strand:+ start:60653 stop:61423 length:771 start_codon:yes stop_codon:yes gene_type:complete
MNCRIVGTGDPLVLIHGWGMNSNVWNNIEADLSKYFKLIMINLPGMGSCKSNDDYDMSTIVDSLNKLIPKNAILLGWSLGGQIAMAYQRKFPQKIKHLILVSSTPCFINKKEWNCGVEKDIFEKFASQLFVDWKKTIHQFFLLQLYGLPNIRKVVAKFEDTMLRDGMPDPRALISGLKLLLDTDYRKNLLNINVRTLIISGDRDRLTPLASSKYMADIIPKSVLRVFPGAGHIPFLFEPEIFVQSILNFIQEKNDR